jgi:hypothetical protein
VYERGDEVNKVKSYAMVSTAKPLTPQITLESM